MMPKIDLSDEQKTAVKIGFVFSTLLSLSYLWLLTSESARHDLWDQDQYLAVFLILSSRTIILGSILSLLIHFVTKKTSKPFFQTAYLTGLALIAILLLHSGFSSVDVLSFVLLFAVVYVLWAPLENFSSELLKFNLPAVVTTIIFTIIIIYYLLPPPTEPFFSECPTYRKATIYGGKIVVLGFDGANWEILTPLLEENRLPNLRKLIDKGASGELESLKHKGEYKSPVVWTTIFTGKTPDQHGITDYLLVYFDKYFTKLESTPPTSGFRKTKALWNILTDYDISSGFTGLWSTWPAEETNGFMVSDHLYYLSWHQQKTKTSKSTYPPKLEEELKRYVYPAENISSSKIRRFLSDEPPKKENSFNLPAFVDYHHARPLQKLKLLYALDKTYLDCGTYLNEKIDPQVLFIYFEGADMVQHYFWGYRDPVNFPEYNITDEEAAAYKDVVDKYFIYLDEQLGQIINQSPENTTYLIISDHGLAPIEEPTQWDIETEVFADHSRMGEIIVSGPTIKSNHTIEGASVLDIAPTLLYLLNLPVGEDMQGKILYDIFNQQHQCTKIPSHDTQVRLDFRESPASEPLTDKLRSLGYLR